MPIYTEWDNDARTIIRIHIHDSWDMSEYIQASQTTRHMMESVSYPVHLIVDLTDMKGLPKNMLSGVPAIHAHLLPDQGLVIGVRYPPYVRAIVRAAIRVFPRFGHNLHFAQTLREARDMILSHEGLYISL